MHHMSTLPPVEESNMTLRVDSVVASSTGSLLETSLREILSEKIEEAGSKSRPPTPPDSGNSSPLGPLRLRSLIPPPNYGTVDVHAVYRSSFPQDRNMDFVRTLKIKTVLTLVDTEPSPGYQQWLLENNIKQVKIDIATNKDGKVKTTFSSVVQAVLFIMNTRNHPLYIHCNQGKHRTGCVVACLRKIQGWPIEEILHEYDTYASKKSREGDIAFIKSFNPEDIAPYVKANPGVVRFDAR